MADDPARNMTLKEIAAHEAAMDYPSRAMSEDEIAAREARLAPLMLNIYRPVLPLKE